MSNQPELDRDGIYVFLGANDSLIEIRLVHGDKSIVIPHVIRRADTCIRYIAVGGSEGTRMIRQRWVAAKRAWIVMPTVEGRPSRIPKRIVLGAVLGALGGLLAAADEADDPET